MDTNTYTLKDLAFSWNIHPITLSRLIKNDKWPLKKINGKHYQITDDDVVLLMYNNPHIQWLAQQNTENRLNKHFLAALKFKYPSISRVYSHHEICTLFYRSLNWFYSRKKKGDFSGLYIQRNEISKFVLDNREYICNLRMVKRDPVLEQLRQYILFDFRKGRDNV